MYTLSLDSVLYICLAPLVLVPALILFGAILETAGSIRGWLVVRRFRLAADNISQTEAFAEVLRILARDIKMAQAGYASRVDNKCRTLWAVDIENEPLPESRTRGEYPAVRPPIDPATKARLVDDFDDTEKHSAIQYPTPLQQLRSNPYYFDSSMLVDYQLVSGLIIS